MSNLNTAGRYIPNGDALINDYLVGRSRTHSQEAPPLQAAGWWLSLAGQTTSEQTDTPDWGFWDGTYIGQQGCARLYHVDTLDISLYVPRSQTVELVECLFFVWKQTTIASLPYTIVIDNEGTLCTIYDDPTIPALWLLTIALPTPTGARGEDGPEWAVAVCEDVPGTSGSQEALNRLAEIACLPQWATFGEWPDTSGHFGVPTLSAPDEWYAS